MKIGRFEVFLLSDGTFRLDGGAMFGVVPKSLWRRHDPADDDNRIKLALGVLLIKTPSGKHVLVDAGLSSKYDAVPKFIKVYGVERPKTLRDGLAGHGLAPADIQLVINTHLHFDHAGGDTEYDESGRAVPAFPKARYLIQKDEWEDAIRPNERNKASYLKENYEALDAAKAVDLVDGAYEIEPGLKVLKSGGHTRGHQCVLIESEGACALFLGDLIPTRSHIPLPYIMGYDLYPLDTLNAKKALLKEALDKRWLLLFQHDPRHRAATLSEVDGRLIAKPIGDD